MAMCPFCQNDKPFFASVCSHCNTQVPLLWQMSMSLLSVVISVGGTLFMLWLLAQLILAAGSG